MIEKIRNDYLGWFGIGRNKTLLEIYETEKLLISDYDSIRITDLALVTETYDYILLSNCMRLLSGFFESDSCDRFLEGIKKHLKNEGHVLFVVQNRIGLKYLAGFPDKTKEFSFLESSMKIKKQNLFSKNELERLIKQHFLNSRFFYFYPDYRNVKEVFNDNTINSINYSSINNPIDNNIVTLFDEKNVNEVLMKNEVSDIFANAFFVDASNGKIENSGDYYKISDNRSAAYSIITEINLNDNRVYKYSCNQEGKSHLNQIAVNSRKSILKTLEYTYSENEERVSAELLKGKTLKDVLDQYIEEMDFDSFQEKIFDFKKWISVKTYKHTYVENEEYERVFGTNYIKKQIDYTDGINIDILFDNVFVNDGWIIIDPEWIFDFPIPIDFVLFRSLNNFYFSSDIKRYYSLGEYLNHFGLSDEEISVFKKMDNHFIYNYIGTKKIDYKANNIVDLQRIYQDSLDAYRLHEIEKSTSWRITKPIRILKDLIKNEK